jgi:hypothetical protein
MTVTGWACSLQAHGGPQVGPYYKGRRRACTSHSRRAEVLCAMVCFKCTLCHGVLQTYSVPWCASNVMSVTGITFAGCSAQAAMSQCHWKNQCCRNVKVSLDMTCPQLCMQLSLNQPELGDFAFVACLSARFQHETAAVTLYKGSEPSWRSFHNK